jgi:adenine-specific DNA-methyltransferase
LYLLVDTLKLTTSKDDIVLDFFSGSATTAHAVMQLNAEDGGNRKFVMVQLPEQTDENSEAYKAGYKTIAEIGRERIRRAGKRIVEENADKLKERETPFDIGFRAYKVADSIMQDVYKSPNDLKQGDLLGLADNIREDKKPEDILTSVILDLGLTLDLPIKEEKIGKNTIFNVDDGSLVACFDKNIDFNVIDEIAKMKPLKVVFRDASFKDDKDRINVETKFKQLSPDTNIKVI